MNVLHPSFFKVHLAKGRLYRALWLALACGVASLITAPAGAQMHNASLLKLPAGVRVAIVEFDDMQCPACAHANPLLAQAAAKYKIPWIRHDFLIPYHNWSKTAAINARWFDTKSKGLGDEYRNEVFANQNSIETPVQLMQFTQRFAQSHGIAMPFAVDPQGKLQAEIDADVALGKQIGISSTPTIYIVTDGPKGPSSVEVKDPDRDLYTTIDQAMASARR
ncbi:MAG TPA: thioredoxin domain-containing protein [Terracidiphilus sp.]|nr:thioredoxin domain-containing protein [Terracidiphilus sp.]